MHKSILKTIAITLAASCGTLFALPYVSLDVGRSVVSSNTHNSWSVAGGYKFIKYLAVEGSYSEYMDKNHSFFAGAKGILPINRTYAVTGDLGGAYIVKPGGRDDMTAQFGLGGTMRLSDSNVLLNFGWNQVVTDSINFFFGGLSYSFRS